jgi:hypothetical protein
MTLPAGATRPGFILAAGRLRALASCNVVMGFALPSADGCGAPRGLAGLTVRLTDIEGREPGPHAALDWTVPDIDAAAQALVSKSEALAIYPGFGQDADGIRTVPDGSGRPGCCPDRDGNILHLTLRG